MNTRSKSKAILALVLAVAIATTGCSTQWINIALQDLPVLTQMALNIATLVNTLASGQQASASDVAVIQNISAQASRDLNLLQTLYSEYKANPNQTNLQKIQNVIADLNQNLPALLQAAHIFQSDTFGTNHRRGQSDSHDRKQFRLFDAACLRPNLPQGARSRLSPHKRFEEAMEPAGLRSHRKCRSG